MKYLIKMTLQEVNVQTNLLYAPDETVSSYNIDSI